MMASHANIMSYFLNAGMVVKLVMLILFAASILSWTLIIQRAWYFKKKRDELESFQKEFWSCEDISKLYIALDKDPSQKRGLAKVFCEGFKAFLRTSKQHVVKPESIHRVMQINQAKDAQQLEKHLPMLASIGSIAPYVGLFGTVWGIMTSFQALGQAQQATIAMVAPGVSEALVATALGLFTAIPAVIAYNRYSTKANILLERYEIFQEELLALIEQQPAQTEAGTQHA